MKDIHNQGNITALFQKLESFAPLSIAAKNFLGSLVKPLRVKKGRFLLKSGDSCQHVYFINRGLLRGFVNANGREITTWINAEHALVSSISGLTHQQHTFENIEVLETVDLLSLHFNDLTKMYRRFPAFNRNIRLLLQQYYADAEDLVILLRLPNAMEKYNYFLQTSPHLANRVALKYIASYLGIEQETLSRLRQRLAGQKG